jgi:hypothetical protein
LSLKYFSVSALKLCLCTLSVNYSFYTPHSSSICFRNYKVSYYELILELSKSFSVFYLSISYPIILEILFHLTSSFYLSFLKLCKFTSDYYLPAVKYYYTFFFKSILKNYETLGFDSITLPYY